MNYIPNPGDVGNRRIDQSSYSPEARQAVISLINENDLDVKNAYNKFTQLSQDRLTSGRAPSPSHSEAIDLLSKLLPLQEVADRLETAMKRTKNKAFNNLMYDNVINMNELLGDRVFEIPDDVMNMSPNDEIREYQQALIQLQNALPQSKGKERDDLLWVNNMLNHYIESLTRGMKR